jgi:CheY-like chemotaxis protein
MMIYLGTTDSWPAKQAIRCLPQVLAGYALAQHWRAQHPERPFILISGDSSNQDLPDIRAGMVRFLVKPFPMEVFLEAVREALGR